MQARSALRDRMVRRQLASRGIRETAVLEAMRTVPREAFVAPRMVEFAYEDAALPIDEGQTISQPYIVALMAEALELRPEDRVLDVGTGSGYAAAVLSRMAAEVFTVERHRSLAESARRRFRELGYDNIHVKVGDGTLGWEERAPFDAINVAAGGPGVPPSLTEQLAPGGRLLIPRGEERTVQSLVRVRNEDGRQREEDLGDVRFVPLIGVAGWSPEEGEEEVGGKEAGPSEPTRASTPPTLPERIARAAEPFESIDRAPLDALLERIGDSKVVLLGEASHGTSEFYRLRARITEALIERKGFRIVAVEADWPDAAQMDGFVRQHDGPPPPEPPFTRFPTWMWVNEEVRDFLHRLRTRNEAVDPEARAGFFGLDLYSLHTSIDAVLGYLDEVDPEGAAAARERYGCLTPWSSDAATYGRAVLTGRYRECEADVVRNLGELLERRLEYASRSGPRRYFDAEQNARLVANAERYYRIMYYGGRESWNLRDQHMFDTLQALLEFHGPDARAVVWAHNSHLGNAAATEMGARGEHNVGQLSRQRFGDGAYLVGFGTYTGTVAAAHDWGDPVEIMDVRPSLEGSHERLCHDAGVERFLLPLRRGMQGDAEGGEGGLRRALLEERLERAIGVIYRPATERASHYFHASLPRQFDEYAWFDRSEAVTPIPRRKVRSAEAPETFPFAV